ncbi:MAG: ubiquinone-dependent pyruvate dehydrogenase [Desulfovibrio sp.]|nr:ubiquinone-dependent pyruvate dehydrogenase [Desulfovibrio sp.]
MGEKKGRTVAEQITDMLAGAGVKRIYAITGDSLNALTDALVRDGRIRFIHMRHEEAGAFAASAEAQLTGSLAVCAGSSGPGHVHLINGLYDAQRSDAPVLAIASTCPSAMFGTGYFQETNPILLFSNCNFYNQMAANAGQVPHMFQNAMQHAVSQSGVAVVGLPQDVSGLEAVGAGATMEPLTTDRLPEAAAEELGKAADILNGAKKVAIFAGLGAAGAVDELAGLADLLAAPVVTTYKSQLEITRNCPNYVGHLAYLGMWSGVQAIAEADAILIIGTNFPYPGFFPAGRDIIQVDVRPERIGKVADVGLGIRADSKLFIDALTPKIRKKTDRAFLDKALANYAEILAAYRKPVESKGKIGAIRPEYFFSLLDKLADDDCVFTVDTGMNNLWSSHYLTCGKNRKMIGSFMHGSMANAMPQAIGAALACPGRQIVSLSGDGGLAMLLGDLLTIIQYKLPIKIFVADNRTLGFVKWEMELAGFKPEETSLDNPDFGAVARAMGFQAETVADPAKLEDAVRKWLAAPGPALLSVQTDPDAASFSFSQKMMADATPANPVENF